MLVAKLGGERPLAPGVAAGVEDQRVAVVLEQGPPGLRDQALLPQVLERRTEDPHHAGPAAGQRASDRIRLVSELGRHLSHPLLGLLRHLDPAERVRHRGGRYAGGIGHFPDRDALGGRGHG
jgi:hypothetical protein